MCPEKARVFIAEDDEEFRSRFIKALNKEGHRVVMEVDTLERGLNAISQAIELGVNVA